jgi:RNA polymerase sigma factor (TIGR02999 family)
LDSAPAGPSASATPSEITRLLIAWREGDGGALDRLIPLVYDDLRALAAGYLRRERPDHTLQPTAVLHDAYLRLVEKTHPQWEGRVHFFAAAAQAMRRILVDHARERRAAKRGGAAERVSLDGETPVAAPGKEIPFLADLLDLDLALERLAALDARKARGVELRYFGGLTESEAAQVLGVSPATVRLDLRLARAWLLAALAGGGPGA